MSVGAKPLNWGGVPEMAKYTPSVFAPPAKPKWRLLTLEEQILLQELINDEGLDGPLNEELLIKYGLLTPRVLSWIEEILLTPAFSPI